MMLTMRYCARYEANKCSYITVVLACAAQIRDDVDDELSLGFHE